MRIAYRKPVVAGGEKKIRGAYNVSRIITQKHVVGANGETYLFFSLKRGQG